MHVSDLSRSWRFLSRTDLWSYHVLPVHQDTALAAVVVLSQGSEAKTVNQTMPDLRPCLPVKNACNSIPANL